MWARLYRLLHHGAYATLEIIEGLACACAVHVRTDGVRRIQGTTHLLDFRKHAREELAGSGCRRAHGSIMALFATWVNRA